MPVLQNTPKTVREIMPTLSKSITVVTGLGRLTPAQCKSLSGSWHNKATSNARCAASTSRNLLV